MSRLLRRLGPVGVGVALLTLVAAVHAALVWPTYGVGSFDDDGHYLLVARNLASGVGFVDTSRIGNPFDPLIPPGYPALLAPLVALPGSDLVPGRVLSLVCAVGLVPLTDLWLRRERVRGPVRVLVALLLAGNVVLATYASMIMAETVFLVVLVAAVLALRKAEHHGTVRAGLLAGLALSGLLLLKTAALGLVGGALLFLLLRRRVRAALIAGVVVVLPQVPLALVRLWSDVPAVGDRYASEIGTFSGPGQLLTALWQYVEYAVADTVVRPGPFFGRSEALDVVLVVGRVVVALLVVLGAAVWWRRRRDATVPMAALYLIEVLFFPFVNERRVVLVLPFVVLWLVLGGAALVRRVPPVGRRATTAVLVVAAVLPLTLQPAQNYLFPPGFDSSRPAGSAYLAMLAELHAADVDDGEDVVVQTSYRWTVSAFTAAHTDRSVFDQQCTLPGAAARERAAAAGARSGYVLTAAINFPLAIDDPCLYLRLQDGEAGAVALLRRRTDLATVYQLLGPGTPWPTDVDHLAGSPVPPGATAVPVERFLRLDRPEPALRVEARNGEAVLTLPLDGGTGTALVRQVSVGAVEGDVDGAALQLRRADGVWETVDARPGNPSFLLARLDEPVPATAVRVVAQADGPVVLHAVRAIGPAAHP